MNRLTKLNKGFTIIEVVLVLAIAGLIFLMVFIALPALQSGQRDTSRRQDVGSVATAVNSFISTNRNRLPETGDDLGTYVTDTGKWSSFMEPVSGAITDVVVSAAPAGRTAPTRLEMNGNADQRGLFDGKAVVQFGARCGTGTSGTSATQTFGRGTARQYVVVTLLETGNGTPFCQDS
jgi:prepilin-type N-terminal cleavage/methylation domain-containing protein